MIDHLSYSSISKYLKCGKQWKFRYLDKVKEDTSEALLFGTAWHKMIRQSVESKDELLLSWSKSFNDILEQNNEAGDWFLDADILGQRMLAVPEIATTIQGLEVQPDTLELPIELRISGVPIPVIGFIDMIGNDGVAIDIKTSGKKWSQSRADTDLQVTFYLAALEQLGLVTLPAKFRFMIFTKTSKPVVQILETERTHADVFALYGLVNEVWQAIRQEVYLSTDPSNWWCSQKWCGFHDICEYGGKK